MDALRARDPWTFDRILRRGAIWSRFEGGCTRFHDDARGGTFDRPWDFAEIAVTPRLAAGDLLILRGDVLHRTQDAETARVAASFRLVNAGRVVRRKALADLCWAKFRRLIAQREHFYYRFRCFEEAGRDALTIGEYDRLYDRLKPRDETAPTVSKAAMTAMILRHWLATRGRAA